MRLRVIGVLTVLSIFLASHLVMSYGNNAIGKISNKSEIPGAGGIAVESFGQFTNGVKIPQWDRENTFINYNLYLQEGIGPDTTSIDQRNLETNPAGIKVLLLGDSFVWGDGVTDAGMMIGTRLQDELNSLTAPGVFTVLSYGKSGASTYNHAEYFTKEKIAEINPDLIVYAYYVNDTVPNFTEKMICLYKTVCNKFSPQTAPAYQKCVQGKANYFDLLVKKEIRNRYPALASQLIVRNCDVIFQYLAKHTHTDEQLWANNKINPWFSTWKTAVSTFANNTKSVPTYMAELYFNEPTVANDNETTAEFVKNGIPVIPMPDALAKVYQVGSGALALNPVNGHANSILTKLYAVDISKYILKSYNYKKLLENTKQPYLVENKLVSSVLPFSVKIKNNTGTNAELSVTDFTSKDAFPHIIAGVPLPPQFVACTDLGYSHIQVNLNRFLKPGQKIEVTPKKLSNENYTLGYYYYDKNYAATFKEVGILNGPTTFTVPQDSHGILLTLGVKTRNTNCSLKEVITLSNFAFTIGLV